MKVLSIKPFAGEIIDFGEPHKFIRYGKESWYECYGSEDVEIFDYKKYEDAYQEFLILIK